MLRLYTDVDLESPLTRASKFLPKSPHQSFAKSSPKSSNFSSLFVARK